MIAYMSGDSMTWPAVRYDDLPQLRPVTSKLFGNAIPDLVLTDASGKMLSSTFVNGEYTDPANVIEDIKKMVPQPGGH